MGHTTSNLLYLVTIICFVLALRFLSSPTTARRGNWVGAGGMAVAIGVTLAQPSVHLNWRIYRRRRNRRGVRGDRRAQGEDDRDAADGGAVQRRRRRRGGARLSGGVPPSAPAPGRLHVDVSVAIVLSALIGSVSFAGSMVAFAKLQELLSGRPITYPGQQVVNMAARGGVVALRRRDRRGLRAPVGSRAAGSRLARRSASCSCCRSAVRTCRW